MPDQKRDFFIFHDREGKRWTRLRLAMVTTTVLGFVAVVLFIQTLLVTPMLQRPHSLQQMRTRLKTLAGQEVIAPATKKAWLKFAKPSGSSTPAQPPVKKHEIRLGFYAGWDPNSLDSLQLHADQLTHLSPHWLTLEDGEGKLLAQPDEQVLGFAKEAGLAFVPRLDNLVMDTWIPEAVEGILIGPKDRRERFITRLIDQLVQIDANGVLIEWNEVDPSYRQEMTSLLKDIAAALHSRSLELWLSVPMGTELRLFDLEALAPTVDHFVAMLHDENSEKDPAGPIASQPWFNGWIDTLLAYGSPEKWIIGLGSYGYDWKQGSNKAETLSFADAMARAGHAGVQDCDSELPEVNPRFSYTEGDQSHTVWFLDALTFANQLRTARQKHVGGIAIFQLGMEDPGIWEALWRNSASAPTAASLDPLQALHSDGLVANLGLGDFISVEEAGNDGWREITLTEDGLALTRYKKFPAYLTIHHQGEGSPEQVAISFDDGPDPDWTPDILDILKEKGAKASFFVVGTRMEDHPELVRRMVAEGHEVGVHTYTHPNLARVSEERALLEFNATQRLIEKTTDRSTLLFRPPYKADNRPHNEEEIVPLRLAQALGYLTVSNTIDPKDWEKPGAATLLRRIKEGRPLGSVILLHDAGGDRSQTVEALPLILDYLKNRGDQIVSLGDLIGSSPSVMMPPLPAQDSFASRLINESGFEILHQVENFLWAFMITATILIVLRTLAVVALALRPMAKPSAASDPMQPLTVLMAAYNEEKVIAQTLGAILRTNYRGPIEVLVVDDGSTDNTADTVRRMAEKDGRIQLLRQVNQGKAQALRKGLAAAAHELVIMLDADTQFEPDTLGHLAAGLSDPRVGAVSGHAKVGNQRTFIARCQALEYTCGFNLDRRAYHQLNCITVVPGAVSAFRKSAIAAAGGINIDTLAEDTDLTLALHRTGLRVGYVPQAIAWTEAPETFSALARQRFRWAFGTMQCLWKHRDLLGSSSNPALGWFSVPGCWFFQILLVAIVPVVDACLIFSLLFGVGSSVYLYFLAFMISDLLLATLACVLEGDPVSRAWRIVPMRFIYRPLLAWVVWKSIFKAAKGAWVGWGKLERTASVSVPGENSL